MGRQLFFLVFSFLHDLGYHDLGSGKFQRALRAAGKRAELCIFAAYTAKLRYDIEILSLLDHPTVSLEYFLADIHSLVSGLIFYRTPK